MALEDLEVFIRERAAIFDENLDLTPGSPFDVQVIQPILKRIGPDPFSVDFFTFAQSRLNQDFPDLATKEGDAVTDLLIKTSAILWDPVLREIQRIKNGQSFRDPTILTVDEADSLGANLFAERERGTFSRLVARVYFAQPQSIAINPSNFFTSRSGLHFFPSGIQSIRAEEMILNQEGTLYYLDVNTTAEQAGEEYNIGPDELVTIANVASAVRVTNKRRARFGTPEETAVEFVDRAQQELTERSLVTLRGIGAQVTKTFPEVTRLAVVGFNDPEMHRDVIKGGGLGGILLHGFQAVGVPDGEGIDATRRLDMSLDGVDFVSIFGTTGELEDGWVLTLWEVFLDAPEVRDLKIVRVISPTVVEVENREITVLGAQTDWTLRKKELTLSDIPGGIIFPDGPNGTVSIPDDEIHIGGVTDVLVRGTDFDTSTLTLSAVVDDSPILAGVALNVVDSSGNVSLTDLVMGTDYNLNDEVFQALEDAKTKQYSLTILEDVGGTAGTYRIISVVQTPSASPVLTLDPAPPLVAGNLRWRLLDHIDIDLITPRETRVSGFDLKTIQNVDYAQPDVSIDLDALGVSPGDILRIETGPVAGDYVVQEVLAPFFDRVRVDREFTATASGLTYSIFRPNSTGGLTLPLVRITSVDLLDTSGQPVGSTVPYAKAIDARSSTFSNFAKGVRVDVRDVRLGMTGIPLTGGQANVAGFSLSLFWEDGGSAALVFTGPNPVSLASMVTQINTAVGRVVASIIDGNRLGIAPVQGFTFATGTALAPLFGVTSFFDVISSRDARSDSIVWRTEVVPGVSPDVDVLQVLDGFQIGFYKNPNVDPFPFTFPDYTAVLVDKDFYPEANRHIQLGFRSVGTSRMYFLEPTSAEFGPDAVFTVESENGTVRYFPDPNLKSQKIPSLPSGTQPKDGTTTLGGGTLTSASMDFISKAIRPGDQLEITTVPLKGTVSLVDPVANLALKTIILSVDGGTNKVITFIHDSNSIPATSVTRDGIAQQINRAVGQTICSIIDSGGLKYLEFETSSSVVVRSSGTANSLLGFSTVTDQNNDSPNKGLYTIEGVTVTQLSVAETFVAASSRQMYKVFRPQTQRISSTEMNENVAETGLYYFDVELVSEGTGDLWNIPADLRMVATGYDSDGYYLTTEDSNLSFSSAERPHMVLSRSILDVGVSDDPENATQLSGQNLQVNYERSSLVGSVNNFITAETERVVNASPLARHLIPYFVRLDLNYAGGSKESEVSPDIDDYIKGLAPSDSLEVSDLENIVYERGANSVTNPMDLIAVVHNFDRTVTVERSKNALNTGRLAAFIPDVITLKRSST